MDRSIYSQLVEQFHRGTPGFTEPIPGRHDIVQPVVRGYAVGGVALDYGRDTSLIPRPPESVDDQTFITLLRNWVDEVALPFATYWDETVNLTSTTSVDLRIGAWVHESSIWIEVSEEYVDLDEAIAAGKRRHEHSIWDLGNDTEIELDYTDFI